jgi:hypothetical protein
MKDYIKKLMSLAAEFSTVFHSSHMNVAGGRVYINLALEDAA